MIVERVQPDSVNRADIKCDWDPKLKILAMLLIGFNDYRKVSNIRRTLVGRKIVDHSDVVGASPVGAAPTTSSFST